MKYAFQNRFYRLIALAVVVIGLGNNLQGALRTASVTGNWNNTATWGGAAVPIANDNIIINTGITVTVNTTTALVTTVVINASGTANGITISGTNILNCGAITMNSPTAAINSTIAVGTGTLNAASIAIPGSGTTGRNCIVSVSTGTINVTGGVTFSGTAAQAQFTFTGAGTLNVGGNLGSGGTFTCSTGTVNFNGTSAQTFPGYTFNILKSNNAAGITPTAAPTITTLTIADVTAGSVFNDGAFAISTATTLNLNSGKYNCTAASFPWGTLNALTGTVDYSLSGTQTVAVKTYYNLILSGSGAKTFAVTTVNNNLTLEGTTTATTSAALTIGGRLDVGAGTTFATGTTNSWTLSVTGTTSVTGTLTLANTGAKSFTDDVTVNSGGIWNETDIAAINLGGSLINNATTFTANSGIHTFSGATKTLSGSTTTSIANVAVTGTYTNSGTLTVGTALSGSGTLTNGNGTTGTLNIGGTSAITTLVATAAGNTVNYTGASQTLKVIIYHNLILSGSGTVDMGNISTINGNFTLSTSTSLSTSNAQIQYLTLTIGGDFNVGSNTSIYLWNNNPALKVTGNTTVAGTVTAAGAGKTLGGDFNIGIGGSWVEQAAPIYSIAGNFTNDGAFTSGTGTYNFSGTNKTIGGLEAITLATTSFLNGSSYTNNGIISCTTLNVSGASTRLTNNGTITVTSALSSGGGVTQGLSGVLNIGGTSTITTLDATTNAGNTVNYTGDSQTIKAVNYSNLILSGSGTDALQTGTTSIGLNLTLSGTVSATAVTGLTIGGAVTLGSGTSFTAGTFTHNLAGNWTNNGTFDCNSGVINFKGTTAQSINGATTFSTLKINNSAGVTTGSVTNVTDLTIGDATSGSIFNDGGYQITGTGALTLTSGTFRLGNSASATNFPAFATNTIGATTTVDYASSSSQIIAAANYGNITNSGNGNRTLASSGTIGIAGSLTTGSGTYTSTGSTINFNGTGVQTVNGITYNNLTISNTGGTCTAGGVITANGTFTTSNGAILDMSTNALSVSTVAHSGTLKTQNTTSTPFTTGKSWGGTVNLNATTGGQTIPAGTYGVLTLGNTSGTQTAGGNLTVSTLNNNTNTADILDMGTNTLAVTTVNNSGTIKTQSTSSTPLSTGKTWGGKVQYNAAAGQTVVAGIYEDLTLCTSGEKTLETTTINGTLSLEGTATTAGTTPSYGTAAAIQYKGAAAQTTGIELPATFSGTGGLTIDNSNGVTLEGGVLKTIATGSNLTITTGSNLTIPPTGQLTVSGTLTNSASNSGLVLKSTASGTASLIHNTSSVPATVERIISNDAEKWHFLSSPVAQQNINENRGWGTSWMPYGTYGNLTGYDLYAWDEPTNCWKYRLDSTSTKKWSDVHSQSYFVPGRGYLYSVQATTPTKTFAGNLNNGTVTYPLTNLGAVNEEDIHGFNLIGNPYPSSIDWKAASGWTRTNLEQSGTGYHMWIWNPTANNYGVCNSDSVVTGTNGVSRYIAPMQGLFVRAASAGSLMMTNAIRIHDNTTPWKSAQFNPDVISAVVTSEADQSADEVRLLFGYPANQPGAAKLFSPVKTAPSLYLPTKNGNYTIRYLTDTITTPAAPVQFKPGTTGNYTLSFNFDETVFKTVFLEDRKEKELIDLRSDPVYRFNSTTSDDSYRFILHFTPVKELLEDELPARISANGPFIQVDLRLITGMTTLAIYDLLGRKQFEQQLAGETQHMLNSLPGTQLLIIKLINPQGQLVRKILCNNIY